MAQKSLEERVSALEKQVAELYEKLGLSPPTPWWRRVAGTLADDATLDEAMRLGREYRESLRPKNRAAKPRNKRGIASNQARRAASKGK